MNAELTRAMKYIETHLNDPYMVTKVENYITDLEKERDEWEQKAHARQNKINGLDYELENHKNWLKVAGEELNSMQKENKHLWALIALKAAEVNE